MEPTNRKLIDLYHNGTFYVPHKEDIAYVEDTNGKIWTIQNWKSSSKTEIADIEGNVTKYLNKENRIFFVDITYDPYSTSTKRFYNDDNGKACFNVYEPRSKVFTRFKTKNKDIPAIYEPFFNNLFPNKDQREWVYDWMTASLFQKNQTYLCLVGKGGMGKGVLCAHIMSRLHGRENWAKVSNEWFSGDAHSPTNLHMKTLFFLDEVNVRAAGKGAKAKLKSLSENPMSLRYMGESSKEYYVHFNVMFASNEIESLGFDLDGSERRYSIPNIGKIPLKKLQYVIDKYEGNENLYVQEMKKTKNIEELWNWLMDRYEPDPNKILISANNALHPPELKEEMYFSNMKSWVRVVYDYIKNNPGKQINKKDIVDQIVENTEITIPSFSTLVRNIKEHIIKVFEDEEHGINFTYDARKQDIQIFYTPKIFVKKEKEKELEMAVPNDMMFVNKEVYKHMKKTGRPYMNKKLKTTEDGWDEIVTTHLDGSKKEWRIRL